MTDDAADDDGGSAAHTKVHSLKDGCFASSPFRLIELLFSSSSQGSPLPNPSPLFGRLWAPTKLRGFICPRAQNLRDGGLPGQLQLVCRRKHRDAALDLSCACVCVCVCVCVWAHRDAALDLSWGLGFRV